MIYDISQPLFECQVFPGDDRPQHTVVRSIENGDPYRLTNIALCVHNGTHVDAPCHFLRDGKGIDQIRLDRLIGPAYVVSHAGDVTAQDAMRMLQRASSAKDGADRKILIKGHATVTLEAAEVFAAAGIDLVGNESQTVGPEDAPMAVHLALLKREIVLLEGIRLASVPEGVYLLFCAPLNLTGCDGSPCRAVLMDNP